jgi:hypothetical protein
LRQRFSAKKRNLHKSAGVSSGAWANKAKILDNEAKLGWNELTGKPINRTGAGN